MDGPSRPDADAADLPLSQKALEGRPRGVFVDSSGSPPLPRPAATPENKPGKRAQGGSWWWAAAPLGIATLLTVLARFQPQRIEELYSRKLYPKIGALLQACNRQWIELSGATNGDLSTRRPSLSEALLGVALGVLLVALIRAGFRGFGAFTRRVLWIGGAGYFAFLLVWGLNHSRMPLSSTLDLDVTEVSAEELNEVALELERDLSQLLRKEDVRGASTGALADPLAGPPIGPEALDAWSAALRRDPQLGWQSEPTLCAPALSSSLITAGISGIFSPFSQEAHVPFGLPETDLAFAACHEIAHVQGWAREDEANYLAWRVGSRSDSLVLRKAALTLALVHVHRALRQANPILQKQRILDMDVRVLTLLEARSTFWSKNRSRLASRAVQTVNDTYLKSQGQEHGVASYGRMVDLLVAELR